MDIHAVAAARYLWISESDRLGIGSTSLSTIRYREMDAKAQSDSRASVFVFQGEPSTSIVSSSAALAANSPALTSAASEPCVR
jgi:hypothetical protein